MNHFYDDIATDYDAITGSASRAGRAEAFLKELTARFPVKSALDVACGTGLYAIGLAKMGVQTVGADISAAMLEQAKRIAAESHVTADWVCTDMQSLAPKVHQSFDAVLCMGNSIPHLLTDDDLDRTLSGFMQLLNPNGIVVLQLLNYQAVLAKQDRIVGITRVAGKEYIRFYDFLPEIVRFNILEVAWKGDNAQSTLRSTTLRPYTAAQLREALLRHGCRSVEAYAGLQFAPFNPTESETVMLVGQKT